jgi:flagellar assembly factor FliW
MKILTAHFGEIEYDLKQAFHFEGGLPGLEEDTDFALLASDETQPVFWLQSLVRPQISLPVVNPLLLCPTYSFEISDADTEALELQDVQDVCILSVLVIPPKNADAMTVNLAAPVILNMKNHQGRQILLNDKNYSTKTPVSELLETMEAKS